jgi:hypothetical protein
MLTAGFESASCIIKFMQKLDGTYVGDNRDMMKKTINKMMKGTNIKIIIRLSFFRVA